MATKPPAPLLRSKILVIEVRSLRDNLKCSALQAPLSLESRIQGSGFRVKASSDCEDSLWPFNQSLPDTQTEPQWCRRLSLGLDLGFYGLEFCIGVWC
mmetsp:Transcript_49212/g.76838  ORF Transcript_49212/g.76838 Transcript_49212/m.76838 type:complete len:98 (+) Transcript_49212:89-382(+)